MACVGIVVRVGSPHPGWLDSLQAWRPRFSSLLFLDWPGLCIAVAGRNDNPKSLIRGCCPFCVMMERYFCNRIESITLISKKASRVWRVSLFFVTLHSTKPTTLWQGGLHNLNGIPRLSIPSVRTAKGKGRFLNVTICKFKLRKLETKCRCNATGASAWVYYTRTTCGISLSEMCSNCTCLL